MSAFTSVVGLVITCLLGAQSIAFADTVSIKLVYEGDISDEHQKYITIFKEDQTLEDMLSFIQESVPLKEEVRVLIGAEDGPLYDPETQEIWMPMAFFEEIEQRFTDAELTEKKGDGTQAVLDVTLHTLIHEIGHAFIAQHEIPTLGKEEDAVDNLANVLLLEYLEDGDLVALNAANMFVLEDADVESFEDEDFWDEHSLDIQRYFTTICHVYGARPDSNEALITEGELSEEKGEQCVDEYELVNHDWHKVLESVQQ